MVVSGLRTQNENGMVQMVQRHDMKLVWVKLHKNA